MFNRKYKKGMADAAKAYEAFGKKQEEAVKYILEEVRQGRKDMESALKEINGNIDNLYDHLQSAEKAKLYTVYTPFDIKELDQQTKLFLVGTLFFLVTDKAPNENQQNYLRAVQKYLDIKEPPFGTNPMAIENVEDIPTQKAILQTVLEYLRLQDGDSYDETELQQDFLDAFSVNAKGRKEIMEHIELLYTATGAKGLAEKYGYVPEEEHLEDDGDLANKKNDKSNVVTLSEAVMDKIVACNRGLIVKSVIETEHYILANPDGFSLISFGKGYEHTICVDKESGEMEEMSSFPCLNYSQKLLKLESQPDTLAVWYEPQIRESHIGIFDLKTKQYKEIDSGHNMKLVCARGDYIVYFQMSNRGGVPNRYFVHNIRDSKTRAVDDPVRGMCYDEYADISENILYFTGWEYNSGSLLYKVPLDGNLVPELLCRIGPYGNHYLAIKVKETMLYLFERDDSNRSINIYCYDLSNLESEKKAARDAETNLANDISGSFLGLGLNVLAGANNRNRPFHPQIECILGKKKHISSNIAFFEDSFLYGYKDDGCLEMFEWDLKKSTRLVQSGVACEDFREPFIRLGSWVYFEKAGSNGVYKVDINNPMQVERVRVLD